MVDEFTLFINGIKPAILLQTKNKEDKRIKILNKMNVVMKEDDNSYLVTRNKKQLEEKKLGVMLGYYPKSVDKFMEVKKQGIELVSNYNIFINYNGIFFNVMGYFDEALEWCNQVYREKMIKKFGKVDIRKLYLYMEEGKARFVSEKIE